MAGVRMTGLVSGLDTETLVQQLSQAYQMKVDKVKGEQTKLEWKKEAWAALNTKIMDFYKGALSTFRSVSTYRAKAATGDFSGVKITAGNDAVNGTHKVQVISTATAQMWTGKKLNDDTYTATSYKAANDGTTKLSDLKDSKGYSIENQLRNAGFTVSANNADYTVKVGDGLGENATVDDVVANINNQLDGSGMKVEYRNGNFLMINDSAVSSEVADEETGETKTVYTGGHDATVTAADATSAKIFGVTTAGVTIQSRETNEVTGVMGGTTFYQEVTTEDSKVTGSTKLIDLGIAVGTEIKINGNAITVDRSTTLTSLATQMSKLGINASYDAGQGRFYLNAKETGKSFTVEAVLPDGTVSNDALSKLGLDLQVGDPGRIDATKAKILYNGVEYEQSTSTFNINGLTIEAIEEGDMQTFTIGTDVQGIYDKIKDFVKSYNDLIEEMNNLYNAPRVKDYEPLTADEKAAMSDDEVEKWEGVIKGSLLRRDDTISTLLSSMRSTLNKQVSVTNADGTTKNYSLSSFGINTSVYTEHGKLHIYGNADDSDFADFDDSLVKAISQNPNAVEKVFSTLGNEIYNNLMKAMARRDNMSSALTFYNDVQIDKEIKDYKDKVSTLEEKMQKEQDKYYNQFAAMESALAKLQSQQNYLAQLFGG